MKDFTLTSFGLFLPNPATILRHKRPCQRQQAAATQSAGL